MSENPYKTNTQIISMETQLSVTSSPSLPHCCIWANPTHTGISKLAVIKWSPQNPTALNKNIQIRYFFFLLYNEKNITIIKNLNQVRNYTQSGQHGSIPSLLSYIYLLTIGEKNQIKS